jgi:transcriptional regulator with XRE-family HTH domain
VQGSNNKPFLKKLGNQIRRLRLEKGLTQLDLAVKMDNYAEQIGRIERGELNATICTLKQTAEGLEIELSELLKIE